MRKMRPAFFIVFIVIQLLLNFPVLAQEEQDAVMWTTVNLEKKLNRKFSLQLTEEFRLRDNLRRLNLFYTDISLNWKTSDWLKTSLSYRWINKYQPEGFFSYRHRLSFDVIFRKKAADFILSYRHRIQAEVRDIGKSADGHVPEWYSRSRFEIKYNGGSRYQPYASLELRYQLRNPREQISDGYWHRNRYALGLQYEIDKNRNIGFYYLIQREFNISDPQQLYVIGLEFNQLF
jgi:hypothetical protein